MPHAKMFGSIQLTPAQPEMQYSAITGRCVCGDTIKLRTDGFWTHGSGRTYCRTTGYRSSRPAA